MLYKERTQAPGTLPAEWPNESPAVPEETKPRSKRTIPLETAMLISMEWHSGQWSALYAFGSSGVLLPGSVGRTLREINKGLQSANLSKSQLKRLQQLRNFIAGHPSGKKALNNRNQNLPFNQ